MQLRKAKEIERLAKAYTHVEKLLKKIDKDGEAEMKLNCTGVVFRVRKDDGIHLRLRTLYAQLKEEIAAFVEIQTPPPVVAPVAAAPVAEEEIKPDRRAYLREYYRQYYQKNKDKYAEYRRRYREKTQK